MDLAPQKFREIVFQLLFSFDMGNEIEVDLIPTLMRTLEVSKKHVLKAFEKASEIWQSHETLDPHISKASQNYSFERIKSVEKNVLRLALYELLIEKTLNTKIILSEAYRIAKKFSTQEGASFVNVLLTELEPKDERQSALSPSEAHSS